MLISAMASPSTGRSTGPRSPIPWPSVISSASWCRGEVGVSPTHPAYSDGPNIPGLAMLWLRRAFQFLRVTGFVLSEDGVAGLVWLAALLYLLSRWYGSSP